MKLWRIDLDAVRVIDAEGRELLVASSVGDLDGPLTVHLAPSPVGPLDREQSE